VFSAPQHNGVTAKWGQIKFQDTVNPATQQPLRKFALTPLCAVPGDYKPKTIQVGWQAVGEDLVLQKSSAITRSPKQQSGDPDRALLQIFHPKAVHHPPNWPHGAQRVESPSMRPVLPAK
jgi:hypothetical protein